MDDPYTQLVELAQRQLAAIRDGRPEDLDGLAAERAALIAALPPTPPASAADALRRALATEAQLADAMGAAHRDLAHRLAHLRRGRNAVRAYGHVGVR